MLRNEKLNDPANAAKEIKTNVFLILKMNMNITQCIPGVIKPR